MEPLSEERKCMYCGAHYFAEEMTKGTKKYMLCCEDGRLKFPFIKPPQEQIHHLFTGNSSKAKLFQRNIRKYNTALAFASVSSKIVEFKSHGPPVVVVQGNIQHKIGSLHKRADKVAAYMQCYFYEEGGKDNAYFECSKDEEALLREIRVWIKANNRIFGQLQHSIDLLKASTATDNNNSYKIVFMDKVSAMPRTYNSPICPEVALITSSDLESTQHNYKHSVIVPEQHNGRLQEIPFWNPFFYPLCYPLFHLYGEAGWHNNLTTLKGGKITMNDHSKYILQVRDPIFRANKDTKSIKLIQDILLCGNGLTQQYMCDLYLAVENNNLNWLRSHQSELKAELYCDLLEARHKHEYPLAGRYIVLPHTHVGSPRWYYGEYQDGMARCRRFHKPDLFITFTCNAKWPEIVQSMKGFEAGSNFRPDLIARCFNIRLELFIEDLQKNCVFGDVLGYMYTVEWQKRGLPHAHILLFLTKECKFRSPADVDRVIRAEIPNPTTHPDLWELVTTNMIHGPCGAILKPKTEEDFAHCCVKFKGTCEEHFPKQLRSETFITPDTYPEYRRRSKADGGYTFYDKKSKCELDNAWVVPYNVYLLLKYGAHINVEICASVKSIKYMNEYVFKGSDKAQIAVTETNKRQEPAVEEQSSSSKAQAPSNLESSSSSSSSKSISTSRDKSSTTDKTILIDEIKQYCDCRYIGPCEACHRLFGFHMHGAKPAVIRMQIHLPDKQSIIYEDGKEDEILNDPTKPPHSQLLGYFDAVKTARLPGAKEPKIINGRTAKDLTYHDMPEHYTYALVKGKHIWSLRINENRYPTIGRMYQVTPNGKNTELYHLRVLLTKREGMASFEELRTFEGVTYSSFKETAVAMKLMREDKEWRICLEDYCFTVTNIQMLREQFVIIIFYNNVENPKTLWDEFKDYLCDDFRYQRVCMEGILAESTECTQDDYDSALHQLSDILSGPPFKRHLTDFNLPQPMKEKENLIAFQHFEEIRIQSETTNIELERDQYENMCSSMNAGQLSLMNTLNTELADIKNKNTAKCYFIDAPGGTGKTFCLNAFIHRCLSLGLKIIVTSYSGVAALLLRNGRTAHSQFKFPLNQNMADSTLGTLKATEALGKELYAADVIFLDELPMLPKKLFELLHNNCIDLHHRHHPELKRTFNTPFAGKLIISAGDLRQCLPIQKYADRTTIVQSVVNRSHLWVHFKELHLSINERVMKNAIGFPESYQQECKRFADQLLMLGDGTFPTYDSRNSAVNISQIIHTSTTEETSLKDLVLWCYPEFQGIQDTIPLHDKAILCVFNEDVAEVNKIAIDLVNVAEEEQRICFSADELDKNCKDEFKNTPIEYLHSLEISGFPPHELNLKIGCPVILLRNYNPRIGLCNGTKLIVHRFIKQSVIEFEIVSEGRHKGTIVPLCRIEFTTSETDFPFIMIRRQFPVRLAFAMSINKAQGQSLKRVGIYLKRPVFAHGQAYVAASRAGIPSETRILLEQQEGGQGKVNDDANDNNKSIYITPNIVYKEVFSRKK